MITEKFQTPNEVALWLRTDAIQKLMDAAESYRGVSSYDCLFMANDLLNVARSLEAMTAVNTRPCYLGGPHVWREDEGTCTWCDKGPSEVEA